MIREKFLKAAQDYYNNIAGIYRELRTTDSEPVLFIKNLIDHLPKIEAADVGAGSGRYSKLFFDHISEEKLFLNCFDTNEFMLESLEEYLNQHKISNFVTKIATAEELPLAKETLNAIFCFNAIHHFNMQKFLVECIRVLKKNSLLFIYTRTKKQSVDNIWGKYFPLYNKKESRLYETNDFEFILEDISDLKVIDIKTFKFERKNSMDELVNRATSKHYSAFTLYDNDEFSRCLDKFKENLYGAFNDMNNIKWIDEKIMYVIKKD
ncbi:MAG: class I SAM-dependent methyltransferase [Thermodesulfobacteriota bacterium]